MGTEEQRFKVIGLLVEIEEAAKRLYTFLADNLPEHRAFWEEMATEEDRHAALIRMLGASVACGDARYNPDKFEPANIQDTVSWIKEQFTLTKANKNLTHKAALEVSLAVENIISEKTFFEAFEGVSSELKQFLLDVRAAQDNHRDKVKKIYDREIDG